MLMEEESDESIGSGEEVREKNKKHNNDDNDIHDIKIKHEENLIMNINDTKSNAYHYNQHKQESLLSDDTIIFPSHKRTKCSLFEIMLMSMFCLVLLISLIFLVFFFIIERIPSLYLDKDMIKSLLDTRTYEIIQLFNGIEVMLISEPNSLKSAFGFGIKAGLEDDNKYGISGLGNLVKEIILNGPLRSEINDLISYGFGLPLTNEMELFTLGYCYDVSNTNLLKTLEVFAKMIKLNENDSSLEKRIIEEVDNLDVLYRDNVKENIDGPIKKLIMETIGDKKHFYDKTGPKEMFYNNTFSIEDLKKIVIKYYHENYVGEKTKIVVLSNMKIREMKGIIIKLFSDIPSNENANKEISLHLPLPKSAPNLGKVMLLRFNEKSTIFKVSFIIENIPYDTTFFLLHYIDFLITSDQRQGSLLFILKKNNYIVNHFPVSEFIKNNTAMISFGFHLTQRGLINIDEVLFQIFNYFKLIRNEKPGEMLYNELIDCRMTKFYYQDFNSRGYRGRVISDIHHMFEFKKHMNKLPIGSLYIPPYNKQFIEAIMDILIPQNALIIVSIKSDKAAQNVIPVIRKLIDKDVYWESDDIYDVKYSINAFNKNAMKDLESVTKYDNELNIRAKNEFISKKKEMVFAESKDEELKRAPELLVDMTHVKLYHKLDRTFHIPKIFMILYLTSPFHPSDSAEGYFMFMFHYLYIKTAISFEFSAVKEAGSDIFILQNEHLLEISINAYSDIFDYLLKRILEIYYNLDAKFITESMIFNQTESFFDSYRKKIFNGKAIDYFRAIIKNHLMVVINTNAPYNYRNIINKIKKESNETYVRGIIYGNINRNDAMILVDKYIIPYIKTNSVYFGTKYHFFNENDVIPYLLFHIDFNGNTVIRLKRDLNDEHTSIINIFYIGTAGNESEEIMIMCLQKLMEQKVKELMKINKYAYMTVFLRKIENNYYFAMIASQPNKLQLNPIDINKELDEVLRKTKEYIEGIDEMTELYKFKYNTVLELKKSDQSLNERARSVGKVIALNKNNFDRNVEYTIEKFNKEFTKEMFITKYKEIFYENVKKISIQKTYKNEIDMTWEEYGLNNTIHTVITDDLNYFKSNN